MRLTCLVLTAALSSCGGDKEEKPPPAQIPPTPVRGAAGDHDLRVMLAELASAKACERMNNSFRGLDSRRDPMVTTGVLWIRECKVTSEGTKVTFRLGGQGWQWADKRTQKAGGTFELREYIKFDIDAKITGTLDIAYDTKTHVASIWFSPTAQPQIDFKPIGDVDVDSKGLWSSVIGGISSAFLSSPDSQGKDQTKQEGTQSFTDELAAGMTVAIDLCTGYQRFSSGRAPKGKLGPPEAGETRRRPIEIYPGGLLAFGPYLAPDGMSIDVHSDGPVRIGLACVDEVGAAARSFIAEQDDQALVQSIKYTDITGKGRLEIPRQQCKVALVARSIADAKVTFDWRRPPREIAQSTGGPTIHCSRDQAVSSPQHGTARRAPARRR